MAIQSLGCACGDGNGNTGTGSCPSLLGRANGLGTQELVDANGALNEIDISTAIGTTFLDFFTDSSVKSRIYPISKLKNIDFPQEETQYDTDNTNQKDFLREGILSFAAEKRGAGAVYASKLNQGRCIENGQWVFTEKGVVGVRISDHSAGTYVLRPIPVSAFSAQWMPEKGDAVEKVMVTFDFSAQLNVGELWLIPYAELGMTLSDFNLAGLQDVNYSSTTTPVVAVTTTFDSTLITDYGDGIVGAQNVNGQLITDFVCTNLTTALAVTITAVNPFPDIKYEFEIPNQTSADVVRMAMVTASGFDGFVDVTIP